MLNLADLDEPHLIALSKALHEARFCELENNPEVSGSPLVADLHEWTLVEQRRRDENLGRSTDWDGWLEWHGRPEVEVVVSRLRRQESLLNLVASNPSILREMLRPFVVTDTDLGAMIEAAQTR